MGQIIANARKLDSPFFAAVAKRGKIISKSRSFGQIDPISHAEIVAIRKALKKLNRTSLRGFTLYSTCEPCPMCLGAAHWSGISELVFGARLTDSKRLGFNEIIVPQLAMELKKRGVKISKDVMRQECLHLFKNKT